MASCILPDYSPVLRVRKEVRVFLIGFAACVFFSWALTFPPHPHPLHSLLQFRPSFDDWMSLQGLKVTSKFRSTTTLKSWKKERSTLHYNRNSFLSNTGKCFLNFLTVQSWAVGFQESRKYLWHLFDTLQPIVTKVLTGLFIFQLAGLAVIAFGLWLRFGGVMADFASDKKSPEYFFMGKLKCLWWQ